MKSGYFIQFTNNNPFFPFLFFRFLAARFRFFFSDTRFFGHIQNEYRRFDLYQAKKRKAGRAKSPSRSIFGFSFT